MLIKDKPHTIKTCSNDEFTVFDCGDAKVTVDGENSKEIAAHIVKCINLHDELVKQLKETLITLAEAIDLLHGVSPNKESSMKTIIDAPDDTVISRSREALKKAGAL